MNDQFSQDQIGEFERTGFLVARKLADDDRVNALRQITERHLAERVEPFELEADVALSGSTREPRRTRRRDNSSPAGCL